MPITITFHISVSYTHLVFMKTLLKGGTVVSAAASRAADVLIEGEKILAVGENLPADGAAVVDVTGKLLFPGFIDAHTHFDLDVCSTTTADNFDTGTRSAIHGGTTLVIDFACPNKGESLQYGLDLWHKKADGRSSCDYGFHMTIDDWNEAIRAEIPAMFLSLIHICFAPAPLNKGSPGKSLPLSRGGVTRSVTERLYGEVIQKGDPRMEHKNNPTLTPRARQLRKTMTREAAGQ